MAFKQIHGQEPARALLQHSLKEGRVAKAYLFEGPAGVGKKMAAFSFAKALNCQTEGPDACEECASCRKIQGQTHPDVFFLGSVEEELLEVTTLKIEQVRQLKAQLSLRPYEGRMKVAIIDNAHQLTDEAANALLKVLEEPPQHSTLILVSAKPNRLFPTIISRCQRVKFRALGRQELSHVLVSDYSLERSLAHFFGYFAEGRLGYALALSQRDFFQEKNRLIDAFVVRQGSVAADYTFKERQQLRMCVVVLCSWFRDLYLLKTGVAEEELIHLDRRAELLQWVGRYSFGELDEILALLSSTFFYIDQNSNIKLLLSQIRVALWKN